MNWKKYRHICDPFPTLFDLPELWCLNSTRAGGKFNMLFFWLYPILLPGMFLLTLLCLIEYHLTKPENRHKMTLDGLLGEQFDESA